MRQVLLTFCTLIGLNCSVFCSPSDTLFITNQHSVQDLSPWLFVRIANQVYDVTEVIDTLVVQQSYEFQFVVSSSLPQPVTYSLIVGGNSVFSDWVSIGNRMYKSPREPIQFTIDPGQEVLIRFRLPELDRMAAKRLSPQLLTPHDVKHLALEGKYIQPFFIGIFLFMVIFNLIYFMITGWAVYLKYSVYLFLCLLFFSHHFGLLQIVFDRLSGVSNNLIWILSSLIATSYILFIIDFGEFRQLNSKAYQIFKVALYYKCIQIPAELIFWALGFNFIHTKGYLNTILCFEIAIVLYGLFYLFLKPSLRTKIVIAASFILLLASILGQLNLFHLSGRVTIIEIGTVIEIMIFSISLALKTKEIDQRRIAMTEQLLEKTVENIKIQEQISVRLEQQVQERTEALKMRNDENEMLLMEVHHRIKNNLQIISSLINIKARTADRNTTVLLQDIANRIYSLGLTHEMLYKSSDLRSINMKDYLTYQFELILATLSDRANGIDARINIDMIEIEAETAIYIGLIHNELLTNAIKYAFAPDQTECVVEVCLKVQGDKLLFTVIDNGLQLSSQSGELVYSFGLRFVDQLVRTKLQGSWSVMYKEGLNALVEFYPINQTSDGEC